MQFRMHYGILNPITSYLYRFKTTLMKNINIPNPCSENWNEMTPTEKGAFCQKCALEVYDFTNKTGDEIRDILTLNIGSPVCMRIQPKQLDELNDDFAGWKMSNKQSFHRAWVFTLFVVFGMTLFSCEEDEETIVEKYHEFGQTILSEDDDKEDVETIEVKKVDSDEDQQGIEPSVDKSEPVELIELLGEVAYEGPIKEFEEKTETVIRGEDSAIREVYAMAGAPMMTHDYNDYLLEKAAIEGVVNEVPETNEITGLVYPNPAANETILKVNMPQKTKGEIELFSLNGQKVRTIHSGRLKKGESEFHINLTDLETGFYLVVIHSGDMKETVKFSKM